MVRRYPGSPLGDRHAAPFRPATATPPVTATPSGPTASPSGPTAAALLRLVGLMADGPAAWGRPISTGGPGVYLVELPTPPAAAPLELARVGKWLERLPDLRLDGDRPTSKALAATLAGAWLPGQTVLYVGATTASIGGRLAALFGHVTGDRRPHLDGHWLHLLRPGALAPARLWWASTDAPEEYLDALLDAFSAAADGGALPWANSRTPSGRRRESGITGSVLPAEPQTTVPPTRRVSVPDGDAEGARTEPRGTGTVRRAQRQPAAARSARPTPIEPAPERPAELSTGLTVDGHRRLLAELEELTTIGRPQVIARIRAAKELGDLKENSDYAAAREEQSFLEGRVQSIEARLRLAVVVETDTSGSGRASLGSTVQVEESGDEFAYTLVGNAESDPAAGRISIDSPVGKALVGARAGDDVVVKTPRGEVRYRVTGVG